MGRLGALIVLLVLAGVGLFFFTGGTADPGSQRPDIDQPSARDATEASDSFLAWLSSRPDWFWTGVGGLLVVAVIAWFLRKNPVLFWLLIGGVTVFIVMKAMS